MSDFDKIDTNEDGVLDKEEFEVYRLELQLEGERRKMEDEDAKRDSQRKMAWFSLIGFLLFPFSVVGTEYLGLDNASNLLADMSSIYYLSVSALLGAYFGFSNMNNKK
jgi:hypothetical protein